MHNAREQARGIERAVQIPIGQEILRGDLALPVSAIGIVVFAHGSGSGRHSPRNRFVAQVLQQAGLATLLMDLLTSAEEAFDAQTAALRFDIELLARRLMEATDWMVVQSETSHLPIGYFGASTGAAAALVAAAELPDLIEAVVLRQVVAPTLLIVGSRDPVLLELNRKALAELPGQKNLEIVPGATHLFEEPGALEAVAQLARSWFSLYLGRANERRQAA